eukprot:TRINITY_DN1618_c0_g3_i1.p1 TRINITY_DN1618_c0_g3~~TRINITY_DN1618_c0_g3_i1.p1  ORF type:complete len:325 (-),score=39.59 TRINITY_DN1618_c0_g3_i1:50-1024(-)
MLATIIFLLKWPFTVIFVYIVIRLTASILHNRPEAVKSSLFHRLKSPIFASHRGGSKSFAPENTMYGYKKCVYEFETEVLEFDVRRSKDGALVIMHDEDVSRTTDGIGLIPQLTLAEIKKLDAAYNFSPDGIEFPLRGREDCKVPTLGELLDEFEQVEKLVFLFDLKEISVVEEVIQIIKERKLEHRSILGAVFPKVNARMMELKPEEVPAAVDIRTMIKLYSLYMLGFLWLVPIKHEYLGVALYGSTTTKILTKNFVSAIHERGRKLAVFGIDLDTDLMQNYCLELGVDLLISDRPDMLKKNIETFRTKRLLSENLGGIDQLR